MKLGHTLRSALAACALVATSLPGQTAPIQVYSFANGSLSCLTFPCSAGVGVGNLSATTPSGYQGLGFNQAMVHNWAAGNPAGPASFSISGLPTHTSLNLGFLLAIIDSWDGSTPAGGTASPDYLNITVDGVSVFSETFDNFLVSDQSASTSNQLSFGSNLGFNGGWNDSAYDFTGSQGLLNIAHSASSVTVNFFASGAGWQGGSSTGGDESFGLDKIVISLNVPNGVPEPGSLALLGAALAGLALSGRRRHPVAK
jgi:hypothetical protein